MWQKLIIFLSLSLQSIPACTASNESGEKKIEVNYKNSKEDGLKTYWYKNKRKKYTRHFKNGIENGVRKEWDEDEKLTYEGNYVDGVEEIK